MMTQRGGRQVLLHGLFFVMAGLLWGLVVPSTPYPRLALSAHIQFAMSGLLFMVTGMLLMRLPHRMGSRSMLVVVIAAWLNWPMVLSAVANAWWGATEMLPIAGAQAGATGGEPWQEAIVNGAHIIAGVALIAGWALLVIGFVRAPSDEG